MGTSSVGTYLDDPKAVSPGDGVPSAVTTVVVHLHRFFLDGPAIGGLSPHVPVNLLLGAERLLRLDQPLIAGYERIAQQEEAGLAVASGAQAVLHGLDADAYG